MSGYQAFTSWVNYLKTELTGSGITVVTEKHEVGTPPYLRVSDGPDYIKNEWLSSRMCQAWLVVAKGSTKPVSVSMGEALDRVIRATTDPGQLEKWDYTTTPKTQVGTFIPKVTGVSEDKSADPNLSKKVITWELHSSNR